MGAILMEGGLPLSTLVMLLLLPFMFFFLSYIAAPFLLSLLLLVLRNSNSFPRNDRSFKTSPRIAINVLNFTHLPSAISPTQPNESNYFHRVEIRIYVMENISSCSHGDICEGAF